MKCQAKHQFVGFVLALLATATLAGTPAIIPLPRHIQTRPGAFTLCPAQPIPVLADRDVYAGVTGARQTLAIYVLRPPARKAGPTDTTPISVAGRGGADSSGNVCLPNLD
jgi:hypothetical protein